jgi:subtilisin family serine protease
MARWGGLSAVAFALAVVLAVPALPARAATDPAETYQWALTEIKAKQAREVGTGEGITIAIIDTGVDLQHEDLSSKIVTGTNLVSPGQPPQDDNGRGTHVAGVAAALTDNGRGIAGVAPDASIMPVKVYDANQSSSTTRIVDGMKWAADHGADVVDITLEADFAVAASALGDGINYVWAKGAIPVVSAGNRVVLAPTFADKPALVVAATTRAEGHPTAYESNVGDAKWALSAPGGARGSNEEDDILSTYWPHTQGGLGGAEYGRYRYQSGTSQAAAHVAGAAAVLRGLGLTRDQTVQRLLVTAKDIGAPGRDRDFGAGLLDVAKAVQGLHSTSTSTTTTTVDPAGTTTSSTAATTAAAPGAFAGPTPTTAFRSPVSIPAPTIGGAPAPTTTSITATTELAGNRQDDGSSALGLILVLAALVVLSGAGGSWWWRRTRPDSDG